MSPESSPPSSIATFPYRTLPDNFPVARMINCFRAVSSPSKRPRISATSIPALPTKTPCSAIWMTRLSIEASTRPSTTSVSQSVISAPFSLMSGPTISLLTVSPLGRGDSVPPRKSAFGLSIAKLSAFSGSSPAALNASCSRLYGDCKRVDCGTSLLRKLSSMDAPLERYRSFTGENPRPKAFTFSNAHARRSSRAKSCNCRTRSHEGQATVVAPERRAFERGS